MGVGAVTYPRRSAWSSIIDRSSAEGRAALEGDDASRDERMVWKGLPLIDSVESMERDREAKLSTRGGMMAGFSVRNTANEVDGVSFVFSCDE